MVCSFEDLFWSLPFAIGWIVSRDAASSQSYADTTSSAWKAWRNAEFATGLGFGFVKPEDEITPVWHALKEALLDGRISATGRPKSGPREAIPSLSWIDAVSPLAGPTSHDAVMLARKDVLRLWPAKPLAETHKRRGPQTNKTRLAADSILADLRAGTFPSGLKKEAQAEKYGVSRDTLSKALDLAMSELSSRK